MLYGFNPILTLLGNSFIFTYMRMFATNISSTTMTKSKRAVGTFPNIAWLICTQLFGFGMNFRSKMDQHFRHIFCIEFFVSCQNIAQYRFFGCRKTPSHPIQSRSPICRSSWATNGEKETFISLATFYQNLGA